MYQPFELSMGQTIETPDFESIDLSGQKLGNKTAFELTVLAQTIPQNSALNLSGNKFEYETGTDKLITLLQALPQNIYSLKLRLMHLGKKSGAELVSILQALPKGLRVLDLGWNALGNKSASELIAIAQALPESLVSLDLSFNFTSSDFVSHPGSIKHDEGAYDLIDALPLNVQTVTIVDKVIDMKSHRASLLVDSLLSQLSVLIDKKNKKRMNFTTIKLSFEIDEACFNQIMPILRNKKTALAYLACGLLLEGQIPNTAEEKYGPLEFEAYIEQRTHDAIDFYLKASADPAIKPIAEFLLWEMKISSTLTSVKKRLAEFDVQPSYLDSFNITNKKQEEVKLNLPKELGMFTSSSINLNQSDSKNENKLRF